MLVRSLARVLRTQKTQKLIPVNILYNQQRVSLDVPAGASLAKHMDYSGINLGFDCGYACSCGTCAVRLSETDY